jgi:hypothetical protein
VSATADVLATHQLLWQESMLLPPTDESGRKFPRERSGVGHLPCTIGTLTSAAVPATAIDECRAATGEDHGPGEPLRFTGGRAQELLPPRRCCVQRPETW